MHRRKVTSRKRLSAASPLRCLLCRFITSLPLALAFRALRGDGPVALKSPGNAEGIGLVQVYDINRSSRNLV